MVYDCSVAEAMVESAAYSLVEGEKLTNCHNEFHPAPDVSSSVADFELSLGADFGPASLALLSTLSQPEHLVFWDHW